MTGTEWEYTAASRGTDLSSLEVMKFLNQWASQRWEYVNCYTYDRDGALEIMFIFKRERINQ